MVTKVSSPYKDCVDIWHIMKKNNTNLSLSDNESANKFAHDRSSLKTDMYL